MGRNGSTGVVAAVLALIATPVFAGPDVLTSSEIDRKRQELQQLESGAGDAEARRRGLAGEVADLAAGREQLNRRLLDTTAALQESETQAAEIETRVDRLADDEKKLADSLAERRNEIAKILTVLQRMGRKPPPALLARPQDILEALRGGQALETMLAPMRAQAKALQADLTELLRLREQLGAEKRQLADAVARLKEQRAELAQTVEARQKQLAGTRSELAAENDRARSLARQATTLKDLIARMEARSPAGRRAAEAARAATQGQPGGEGQPPAGAAPFQDAGRLAPVTAFRDLKGKLHLPAIGTIVRRYGAPNDGGGLEKGLSIATRDNAVVVSPSDGWVSYAGPYRSYGQLLIINAGGGYYVVLAGMNRANVNVGQFVLAGEPVAVMGDGAAQTAATVAIGASKPILYVEFRKDGASIDPGPWWAESSSRKGGG